MAEKKEKDNTWKIVTGVLAGLFGWYAAGAMIDAYHHNRKVEQFNEAVERLKAIAPPPTTPAISFVDQVKQRQEEATRQKLEAKQLAPGERCFDGQRFKRLENGWQQLPNQPC